MEGERVLLCIFFLPNFATGCTGRGWRSLWAGRGRGDCSGRLGRVSGHCELGVGRGGWEGMLGGFDGHCELGARNGGWKDLCFSPNFTTGCSTVEGVGSHLRIWTGGDNAWYLSSSSSERFCLIGMVYLTGLVSDGSSIGLVHARFGIR